MTNKKMNLYFLTLLIISSFFISQKSHALSNTDKIISLSANHNTSLSYIGYLEIKGNFYEEDEINFFGTYSDSWAIIRRSSIAPVIPYIHDSYTIQDCFDAGFKIMEIIEGFPFEGRYFCSSMYYGISEEEFEGIINPDNPDNIYTPEQFDGWICGQDYIKNKLTYNYFPDNQMIDYKVRKSIDAGRITGSNTLEIISCGDEDCTFDKIVSKVREYIPFAPSERIHGFENDFGGFSTYEVFAYCKAELKQKSISDLTSDEIDCRKGIYQFTGESGSSLSNLPESSCYEEENRDYSFKQWCEAQFSEDVYWVEGQLEEYCDPPEKQIVEEKMDDGEVCEITTEVLDVSYNTDQSRSDITKTIKKKVVTKNCDGEIISEEIIENTITVDKTDIQGDGSDKPKDDECFVGPSCPPSKGTGEGTGEGVGESEAGSDSGTDWGSVTPSDGAEIFDIYTPIYTEDNALELIFNKHLTTLEDSRINDLFEDMNPFSNSNNYNFPKFHLDLNSDDFQFGEYKIDLENFTILDTNINLILILKAVLLLITAFFCIREIF